MTDLIRKLKLCVFPAPGRQYLKADVRFANPAFIKILAVAVINCFLLTSVYGQSVAAVLDNSREKKYSSGIFEEFVLPYSYGMITGAYYGGSETAVISIQDLHAHPQVQQNISNIIQTFENKYGIKNIYLEGAYGQVDTSWINAVKEEGLREKLLEAMLASGRLTGAEYYSVKQKKEKIIKGLEDKQQYLKNLKRFSDLLDSQEEISLLLSSIEEDINDIKKTYYNRKHAKIEELKKKYAKNEISAKKYYALMYKYADKLGIDIDKFKNVRLYTRLLEEGEKIKYEKATHELQLFILTLKEILPYNTYRAVVEATGNFTELDKLYVCLIKLSKEKKLDISVNLPELNRFFNYLELSRKINPAEMIKEEQKLTDEMSGEYAVSSSEKEAVFLVSFLRYLKDYLSGKITYDDYIYYKANIEKFKTLWVKYIDNKKLGLLTAYEKNTDAFYDVNMYRNSSFISNIDGLTGGKKIRETPDLSSSDDIDKTIKTLDGCKNVNIIITGGFHTQAVSKLLADKNITHIVITPNVSGGTAPAEEAYHKIAREQGKLLFQTLAVLNISQTPLEHKLYDTANSLILYGGISNEFFDTVVNPVLEEIIEAEGDENMSAQLVYNGEGKAEFRLTKNGNRKIYLYNSDSGEFVDSGAEDGRQIRMKRTANFLMSGIAALTAAVAGALLISPVSLLLALPSVFLLAKTVRLEAARKELSEISLRKALIKNSFGEEGDKDEDLPAIALRQYKDVSGYSSDDSVVFEFNEQKAQKGVLAQYNKDDGKIHVYLDLAMYVYKINQRTKQMDVGTFLSLRNLIHHELRHKKIAESGSSFAKFIGKHSFLEEVFVSLADFPNLITLYAGRIASGIGIFVDSRPKLFSFAKLADISRKLVMSVIIAVLSVQGVVPAKSFALENYIDPSVHVTSLSTGYNQPFNNLSGFFDGKYHAWWQWPSLTADETSVLSEAADDASTAIPAELEKLHNGLSAFERARLGYNNAVTFAYIENLRKLHDSDKPLTAGERDAVFSRMQYHGKLVQSVYSDISALFADESYWRAYRALRGLGANADKSRAALNAVFISGGDVVNAAELRGELNKIIVNGYEKVFKEYEKFYNFFKSENPSDRQFLEEIQKTFPYEKSDDAAILGIIWNSFLFDGDESLNPRAFLDKYLPSARDLFVKLREEQSYKGSDILYLHYNLQRDSGSQRDYAGTFGRTRMSNSLFFYAHGGALNSVEQLKSRAERGLPYYSRIYVNATPYDDLVLNSIVFNALSLWSGVDNPAFNKGDFGAVSLRVRQKLSYGDLLSLFYSGAVEHESVIAGAFNEEQQLGPAKEPDSYFSSNGVSPYRQVINSRDYAATTEQQIMINNLIRNIIFDNTGKPNGRYIGFYLQDSQGRWHIRPDRANAFYSAIIRDVNKDVKAMFDFITVRDGDTWKVNREMLGRINTYLKSSRVPALVTNAYGDTHVVKNAMVTLNPDGLLNDASMSIILQIVKNPSLTAKIRALPASRVSVNTLPSDVQEYKFDAYGETLSGILRDRVNAHSETGIMAGIRADVYQKAGYERDSYISGEKIDLPIDREALGEHGVYAQYSDQWHYKLLSNQILDAKGNIRKQYAGFFKPLPGNNNGFYVDPARAGEFMKLVVDSIEDDIKKTALLVADNTGYRQWVLNAEIIEALNAKIRESWKTSKPMYVPVYNRFGAETGRKFVTISPVDGKYLNDDALYLLSLFIYNEDGTIKSESQIWEEKYELLKDLDSIKYPGIPFANVNDESVRDLYGLMRPADSPYILRDRAESVQAAADAIKPLRKVAGDETVVTRVVLRDDYAGGKILVYEKVHYEGKGEDIKELYTEQFTYVRDTGGGKNFQNTFLKAVVTVSELERVIKAEYLKEGSNLRKYMDSLEFFISRKELFLDGKGNLTAAGTEFLNNIRYSDKKIDGRNVAFTKTQIIEGLFGNADKWALSQTLKSYGLRIGEFDPSKSVISQKASDVLSTLDKDGLARILEFMHLIRNTKISDTELTVLMNNYYPELKDSPLPAASDKRNVLTESNIKFITKFLWPEGTGTDGIEADTAAETAASLFAEPEKGVFIPIAVKDGQFSSFQNIFMENLRDGKILGSKNLNDLYNERRGLNVYTEIKDAQGIVSGRYKTEVAAIRHDSEGNIIITFKRIYETETGGNEFAKSGEGFFVSIITPEQQQGLSSEDIPVFSTLYLETLEKKIEEALTSVQIEGLGSFENDLRNKLVAGEAAELKDAFAKGASEKTINLTGYTDDSGSIMLPAAVITKNDDGTYNVRITVKNQSSGEAATEAASGKLTFAEGKYGILAADPAYITSNPDFRAPVVFVDADGKYILKPGETVVHSVEIVDGTAKTVIRYTDTSGRTYIMTRVYSDNYFINAGEREKFNENNGSAAAGQSIPLQREVVGDIKIGGDIFSFNGEKIVINSQSYTLNEIEADGDLSQKWNTLQNWLKANSLVRLSDGNIYSNSGISIGAPDSQVTAAPSIITVEGAQKRINGIDVADGIVYGGKVDGSSVEVTESLYSFRQYLHADLDDITNSDGGFEYAQCLRSALEQAGELGEKFDFDIDDLTWVKKKNLKTGAVEWSAYSDSSLPVISVKGGMISFYGYQYRTDESGSVVTALDNVTMFNIQHGYTEKSLTLAETAENLWNQFANLFKKEAALKELIQPEVEFDGTVEPILIFSSADWNKMLDSFYGSYVTVDGRQVPLAGFINDRLEEFGDNKLPESRDGIIDASDAEYFAGLMMDVERDKNGQAIAVNASGSTTVVTNGIPEGYSYKMVPSKWAADPEKAAEEFNNFIELWSLFTSENMLDDINSLYTYFDYEQQKEVQMNISAYSETGKISKSDMMQLYNFMPQGETVFDAEKTAENIKREIALIKAIRDKSGYFGISLQAFNSVYGLNIADRGAIKTEDANILRNEMYDKDGNPTLMLLNPDRFIQQTFDTYLTSQLPIFALLAVTALGLFLTLLPGSDKGFRRYIRGIWAKRADAKKSLAGEGGESAGKEREYVYDNLKIAEVQALYTLYNNYADENLSDGQLEDYFSGFLSRDKAKSLTKLVMEGKINLIRADAVGKALKTGSPKVAVMRAIAQEKPAHGDFLAALSKSRGLDKNNRYFTAISFILNNEIISYNDFRQILKETDAGSDAYRNGIELKEFMKRINLKLEAGFLDGLRGGSIGESAVQSHLRNHMLPTSVSMGLQQLFKNKVLTGQELINYAKENSTLNFEELVRKIVKDKVFTPQFDYVKEIMPEAFSNIKGKRHIDSEGVDITAEIEKVTFEKFAGHFFLNPAMLRTDGDKFEYVYTNIATPLTDALSIKEHIVSLMLQQPQSTVSGERKSLVDGNKNATSLGIYSTFFPETFHLARTIIKDAETAVSGGKTAAGIRRHTEELIASAYNFSVITEKTIRYFGYIKSRQDNIPLTASIDDLFTENANDMFFSMMTMLYPDVDLYNMTSEQIVRILPHTYQLIRERINRNLSKGADRHNFIGICADEFAARFKESIEAENEAMEISMALRSDLNRIMQEQIIAKDPRMQKLHDGITDFFVKNKKTWKLYCEAKGIGENYDREYIKEKTASLARYVGSVSELEGFRTAAEKIEDNDIGGFENLLGNIKRTASEIAEVFNKEVTHEIEPGTAVKSERYPQKWDVFRGIYNISPDFDKNEIAFYEALLGKGSAKSLESKIDGATPDGPYGTVKPAAKKALYSFLLRKAGDIVRVRYDKDDRVAAKIRNSLRLVFSKMFLPFAGGTQYFSIETKNRKVLFYGLTFALGAVTVLSGAIYLFPAFSAASPLIMAMQASGAKIFFTSLVLTALLPRYAAGKTTTVWGKRLILAAVIVFAMFWGGFLGGFYLAGIVGVTSWSLLYVLTTALSGIVWMFIGVLTFSSVWQAAVAVWSQLRAIKESASRSDLIKKIYDGVQICVFFASFALFIMGLVSAPLFSVPAIYLAGANIILWLIGGLSGTSFTFGPFWERGISVRMKEFLKAQSNEPVLPDGKEVREEIRKFIKNSIYITKKEKQAWYDALDGKPGAKFVRPANAIGRRQILETFKNIGSGKLPQLDMARLPGMSTHLQAAGEDSRRTAELMWSAGSFDKGTTLLGHIAVEYPEAWENALDKSESDIKRLAEFIGDEKSDGELKTYREDLEKMLLFIARVRKIRKDTTPDMPEFSGKRGELVFYTHVLKNMEDMVSEVRSSNSEVLRSMHEQIKDWHHALANDALDKRYEEALRFAESNFESVHEAYEVYGEILRQAAGKTRISENDRHSAAGKIRTLLANRDSAAQKIMLAGFDISDSDDELFKKLEMAAYFVNNYARYRAKISEKANFVFQDGAARKIKLGADGKVIEVDIGVVVKLEDKMKSLLGDNPDANDTSLVESMKKALEVRTGTEAETAIEYASRVVRWREENAVALMNFMRKRNVFEKKLNELWDEQGEAFFRAMFVIAEAAKYDVEFSGARNDDMLFPGGKNSTMAYDIFNTREIMDARDALVPLVRGQSMYGRQAASEFIMKKRNGYIVLNPAMMIAGNDKAFPTSQAYGYAQDVWVNTTQRALSGLTTFYGKGLTVPQMIASQIHPGEDSMQFMLLRFFNNLAADNAGSMRKSGFEGIRNFSNSGVRTNGIMSGFINFMTEIWQRPTFYSGGTEARYLWNVLLYVIEGIARFINFTDRKLGYDIKVANNMLWMHYLAIPFILAMIAFLPPAIVFSSFAHLLPVFAAVSFTYFFMQAINLGGLVLNSSLSDGLASTFKTVTGILKYLPYFNSMFSSWGVANKKGRSQIFSFFNTVKTTNYSGKPLMEIARDYSPAFGVRAVTLMGLFNTFFAVFTLTSGGLGILPVGISVAIAVVVSLPYTAAGISMISGISVYRAHMKDGVVKGSKIGSFWANVIFVYLISPFFLIAEVLDWLGIALFGVSFLKIFYRWFFNFLERLFFRSNLESQLNLSMVYENMKSPENQTDKTLRGRINIKLYEELSKDKKLRELIIQAGSPEKDPVDIDRDISGFAQGLKRILDNDDIRLSLKAMKRVINVFNKLHKDPELIGKIITQDNFRSLTEEEIKNKVAKESIDIIDIERKFNALFPKSVSDKLGNPEKLSNKQRRVLLANVLRTVYKDIDIENTFSYSLAVGYAQNIGRILLFRYMSFGPDYYAKHYKKIRDIYRELLFISLPAAEVGNADTLADDTALENFVSRAALKLFKGAKLSESTKGKIMELFGDTDKAAEETVISGKTETFLRKTVMFASGGLTDGKAKDIEKTKSKQQLLDSLFPEDRLDAVRHIELFSEMGLLDPRSRQNRAFIGELIRDIDRSIEKTKKIIAGNEKANRHKSFAAAAKIKIFSDVNDYEAIVLKELNGIRNKLEMINKDDDSGAAAASGITEHPAGEESSALPQSWPYKYHFGNISRGVMKIVKGGTMEIAKFSQALFSAKDIRELGFDKRESAKGIRMFVVESLFDENGELTKEGAVAKARAGEFDKRGYTAVIVEKTDSKPEITADENGNYKNSRLKPNATFRLDGVNVTNEHYLTHAGGLLVIQVYTKNAGSRTREAFIEGVANLAAHLNGDSAVSRDSFGSNEVAMINVIGFGDMLVSGNVRDLLPGVYVSRTYLPQELQDKNSSEMIMREKSRKIYPVEDSIAGVYDIDAVNEEIEAESLYKLDEPLVFFHGNVSNISTKEKMRRHIISKRDRGANVLILNAGDKVEHKDGKINISNDLKENIAEARLKGLKVSVIIELSDKNVSDVYDMEIFREKVKALLTSGFDGISIDAKGIKNADNIKKVLGELKELSDKYSVRAVNTIHLSGEMKESVAEGFGQYKVIVISDFNADGELKILSDTVIRSAERKGYERGRKTADRNTEINVKDIYALRGILTAENVSASDIYRALEESGLDSEIGTHIRMLLAKDTPESAAQARGFIKGVVETLLERRYLETIGIDYKQYKRNTNADKDAIGVLLSSLFVSDIEQANGIFGADPASKEKFKTFLRELKVRGADMKVNEMRESVNPFINELAGRNDIKLHSLTNDETAKALDALAIVDLVMNRNLDKLISSARNGTNISAAAIRSMLSAA